MPHIIHASTFDDLPELGRFLTEGFHSPSDAAFAAVDVLRWKYFDRRGTDAGDSPRSYLARDLETGRIVGHVGVCPGRFRGVGLPPEGISTLHMIDWLAVGPGVGVGATLMRRVHQTTDTQYGFGGSDAGRGVIGRGGYQLIAAVPTYRRVLRLGYRLKLPGPGPIGRLLRAARDASGKLAKPTQLPRTRVELRKVAAFGPEIEPILATYASIVVFTSRGPDLLNHMLRYPRGGITGWHLLHDDRLCGFAMLSVVPQPGGVWAGKIVECLLGDPDEQAWHAAAFALTVVLKEQGADFAIACASTDWASRAFQESGYGLSHALEFRLRDRSHRIPDGSTFHLSALEADYAYT